MLSFEKVGMSSVENIRKKRICLFMLPIIQMEESLYRNVFQHIIVGLIMTSQKKTWLSSHRQACGFFATNL